jgi:hypothetical protein
MRKEVPRSELRTSWIGWPIPLLTETLARCWEEGRSAHEFLDQVLMKLDLPTRSISSNGVPVAERPRAFRPTESHNGPVSRTCPGSNGEMTRNPGEYQSRRDGGFP